MWRAENVNQTAKSLHGTSDPDMLTLINDTLGEVDRTLLVLGEASTASPSSRRDIEFLQRERVQLLESAYNVFSQTYSSDSSLFETDAELMWERFSRQEGFALVARHKYEKAVATGKGSRFNEAFNYCKIVCSKIEDTGSVVSTELKEVFLHIYYSWRVQRPDRRSSESIDWSLMHRLSEGLRLHRGSERAVFLQIRGRQFRLRISIDGLKR